MNKVETELLVIVNTMLTTRKREPITTISSDMNLSEGFEFTSLDLAELTARIEAKYGIDIYENKIIHTVGEIVSQLQNLES